jgi:glycosyltransferase involved in cell wall biosynthesis
MRILICSVEAPLPPVNGFRLHLSSLLRELGKRQEVMVLAFLRADQTMPPGSDPSMRLVALPSFRRLATPAAVATAILSHRPFGTDELAARMRIPLREELARFRPDVVHVTSGRLAALGRELEGRASVLAALDAWHLNAEADTALRAGLRRLIGRWQVRSIRRFESEWYGLFDKVIVVTDEDGRALRGLLDGLDVAVIPNGVDWEAFASQSGSVRDRSRVLFTGVMGYAPNVQAAEFLVRRVLPPVRAVRPQAHVALVGRDPAPRVRALAGLEGVEVVGEVADMRYWLSSSGVYACLMRSGTGIKNKLLEALANGMPCVATPLSVQGLRVVPGRHLLVGTEEEELAGHIVRLLSDEALAKRLGEAGSAYVRDQHGWDATARSYERIYGEVAAKRPAG